MLMFLANFQISLAYEILITTHLKLAMKTHCSNNVTSLSQSIRSNRISLPHFLIFYRGLIVWAVLSGVKHFINLLRDSVSGA